MILFLIGRQHQEWQNRLVSKDEQTIGGIIIIVLVIIFVLICIAIIASFIPTKKGNPDGTR